MVVQRKWMYLESIFIGGDIRAQLPEEAKKFDDIDKTFKKVCEISCPKEWWEGGSGAQGGLNLPLPAPFRSGFPQISIA